MMVELAGRSEVPVYGGCDRPLVRDLVTAEYVHGRIRAELGFGHEDARDLKQLLKQGYRGSRYSFGYPACPTLEDQKHLIRLLGAERIGIELAEEFQLHPEQSTSAIVVHHPKAKYFSV